MKQELNCHHVYLKFYLRSLPRQYNKETKKKCKVKHEEQYHYLWMICSCLCKTQVSYWLNIKTDRSSRKVVHIKTKIFKYIAFSITNQQHIYWIINTFNRMESSLRKIMKYIKTSLAQMKWKCRSLSRVGNSFIQNKSLFISWPRALMKLWDFD